MFILVIKFIPFFHKSSDFDVIPRLHILNFGCFVWDELVNGSSLVQMLYYPKAGLQGFKK